MRTVVAAAMLAVLAGCTATAEQSAGEAAADARDQARLAQKLARYTPGEPQQCIRPYRATTTVYGNTILYDDGGTLYRTETSGGCFGLKRNDIIVTNSINSQLCRGDLVRTVDRSSGFPSGACAFGEFTPYKRTRR